MRLAFSLLLLSASVSAQPLPDALFKEMRWRMIGPHRGGRTVAAVGVPGTPDVFYIGVNNGGVWRSDDYGRVWVPIFDDQPTGSVGAIAVAPSDPRVIYVGSGEGLQRPDLSTGDGLYRSPDGGKSWEHLGLRDAQQIPMIVVDPRDANRILVAALGHPYGPNPERGIFRSRDGGKTFEKVLYRDENTGGMDLALAPDDPDVVFAVLWAARQAPWEVGGSWQLPTGGLFKSKDGGTTWRQITAGLPGGEAGVGRIGLAVSKARPSQMFALLDAPKTGGLYRSDDAGESWTKVNDDRRLWDRSGDFAEVKVDPRNPDVLYVANVAAWKSTDGGKTFTGFRGAPGGDDPHRFWIHPENPNVLLLAGDQGAIVTVNGGATWSSWYNQPTAQFYHVATDNQFPYNVYGGQQESGSVGIASRGNDGQITFREWHPVGVEEYGYVAPDPLDPDIVYGGKITRYDRRTGQVQNISPKPLRGASYRVVRTQPVLFSPVDPKTLYFAANTLWKTTNGGTSWDEISPDFTRTSYAVPKNAGAFAGLDPEKGKHRGVIYTVAPSYLDVNVIWAGTDDGVIRRTADGGKTWKDVTPPSLAPWAKVSLIDASHFDVATAYAAVNTFRLDDLRPHVYRTHDAGSTWTQVTTGLPDGAIVNAVREDPVRRGLLYAGTEGAVYVSFDDGDHWQSLRLNMPATSIRDLVVKDDDLVVGTHGRSFWILDDVAPLRQVDAQTAGLDAALLAPQVAYRVRWNLNPDTPLPPEEPAGRNPPDGAIVDYWLKEQAKVPVVLEILDEGGRLVRRFRSDDEPEAPLEGRNIPDFWIRPPQALSAQPGMHRFIWDLHHPAPAVPEDSRQYPIAAVVGETPTAPQGPWVLPGTYTVRLTSGST
ncbi:MAG TPA: glycoside hydrolase, partial [Vicinamibacteria bacterium]|nr:glycoside hydrolase [Vicinamibacteria bacterium]